VAPDCHTGGRSLRLALHLVGCGFAGSAAPASVGLSCHRPRRYRRGVGFLGSLLGIGAGFPVAPAPMTLGFPQKRTAASSGSHPKAPALPGGYLLGRDQ
jgi:uncharacterized membrane protein YfcA